VNSFEAYPPTATPLVERREGHRATVAAAGAAGLAERPAPVASQTPSRAAEQAIERAAARERAGPVERSQAVHDVWRALWGSRALVWASATCAILVLGSGPRRHVLDPVGLTRGLGRLGELLAAPAARWDAAWYLVIAHYGYRPDLGSLTASRTAFFPLYPLGVGALEWLGVQAVLAGVLLSVGALACALYCLHRLTSLEAGQREVARTAVLLTAFAPMAFFFSAVYSESLYLALSIGTFLCARRGRFGWAAALAAAAGATRSTGVLLALPLALLYLYGPRADRAPDRVPERMRAGLPQAARRRARRRIGLRQAVGRLVGLLMPRYRLRRDALWLFVVPTGLVAYLVYLAASGADPLLPFHSQTGWSRSFAGPYVGAWDGVKAALEGVRVLFLGGHAYLATVRGSASIEAGHNVMLFLFLAAAVPALVGVLRRLPLAYGAYALVALALPLSYPVSSQPLMSLPRFLVVLFPLNMWFAGWLYEHSSARMRVALLVVSAAAMGFFSAEFATWHWVA
jgi:hypothetical protein